MTPRMWAGLGAIVALIVGTICWSEGAKHAELTQYKVQHDTVVKALVVVHDSLRVDTVRVARAERKSVQARAVFDTAVAKVEAVADTSAVVPSTLVLPEVQACKDMRDALLEQIDSLKVEARDLGAAVALECRRADLAENALKHATPRAGFKTGAIVVGALWVATHFLPR